MDSAELIALYKDMLKIRLFEERVKQEYMQGKIAGMLHLSIGQEAVAVGICSLLAKTDYITSHHRGHGHFIARGADLKKMMAELYGKSTGYCKGKGGSMHIADLDHGHLGANGIVGGGLAIAAGAALALQLKKETGRVVICFFGDGALNIGEFHESLNLAGLWRLPVVFVCENNFYALSTHLKDASSIENIEDRAKAYGMLGLRVDGMDVLAVRDAASKVINCAREEKGPSFLVCDTYRFLGHGRNPDTSSYRSKEEEQEWNARCPVKTFKEKLLNKGIIIPEKTSKIEREILEEVEQSVKYAEDSPFPTIESIEEDIYA